MSQQEDERKLARQMSTMGLQRHRDNSIVLPQQAPIRPCAEFLLKKADEEEQFIVIDRKTTAFPPAMAVALYTAILDLAGMVVQVAERTMFGKNPPRMLQVPVSYGRKDDIPWGIMELPLLNGGHIRSDMQYSLPNGRICGRLYAEVRGKDKTFIKRIFDRAEELLRAGSIYKGQAIKANFKFNPECPDQGLPEFMAPSFTWEDLEYNADLTNRLECSVLGRIKFREALKRMGVSFKRGVLLHSDPGNGKTALAAAVADLCTQNGVTFLNVENPKEFVEAHRMASTLAPCIVFCEDFDKALENGRTSYINQVLEIIDGIESKKADIFVIFTTNYRDKFPPVLTRDGRMDDIIEIVRPDSECAQRLALKFGGRHLHPDIEMEKVGEILAGLAPPTIKNIVNDAKVNAFVLSGGETSIVTTDAVATTAQAARERIDPKSDAHTPTLKEQIGNAAILELSAQVTAGAKAI